MILIKIGIILMMVIICFYVFRSVFSFLSSIAEVTDTVNAAIDTSMKKRKSYKGTQKKLSRQGIMFRFENYDMKPSQYLTFRLFVGLIVGLAPLLIYERFSVILFAICFAVGFFGLDFYFQSKNKSDNKKMLHDLFNIYVTLKIQLSSNIYITNSLQSCREVVINKRLRKALDELIANLSDRTKTYMESVEFFRNRFNSEEINNFCMFLRSYGKYGISEKYLADIMSEISEISMAATLQDEHAIETKSNLINFLFFACVIAVVIFGAFSMIKNINIF